MMMMTTTTMMIIIIILMMMIIIITIITINDSNNNFLQSPHCARTLSDTCAQVARAQSCANHVQDIERLSRATCRVPRGTK